MTPAGSNIHSTQRESSIDRFRRQPAVVRWGLFAAVALILFLVWADVISPIAKEWGAQADRIQQDVRTVRDRERIAAEVRALQNTIITVGRVQEPRHVDEGEGMLIDAVNESLRGHMHSFDMRSRGNLPRGSLQGLAVGAQPVALTGELRFEATPEDAIAIIAKLESRPEINAIRQTQIQRIGGRRVSVRLTIESWVVGGGTGAARRSL